jgi:CHAD domain-containing protein
VKPKKLLRRWRGRQQQLQAALRRLVRRCRRRGEAEQIHELRVTLRRLRLLIRAGRPLLDERAVTQFRVWAHRVSKLTSPVRDLDVAIEWLRKEPNAVTAVRLCQRKRAQLWLRARPRLQSAPPGLLRSLKRIVGPKDAPARLTWRVRKLERRYEAAVREDLAEFFKLAAEDQHEFRRTLRWWRYLRELTLRPHRHARDRLLSTLIAAQEATGDRQNLTLAETALRQHCRRAPTAKLRSQLHREQAEQPAKIEKSLAALARLQKWGR